MSVYAIETVPFFFYFGYFPTYAVGSVPVPDVGRSEGLSVVGSADRLIKSDETV